MNDYGTHMCSSHYHMLTIMKALYNKEHMNMLKMLI